MGAPVEPSVELPGPALLFCPGDRPDRYDKAAGRADAVILDLEDSVAPEDKERARAEVVGALGRLDPARTVVRVNAPGTEWWDGDVAAVAAAGVRLVMLPKAQSPEDVAALAPAGVIALCETAAGVLAAPQIAAAPSCLALSWGGEDLMADLGGASSRGADGAYRDVVRHARSAVLLAAAAHRRPAVDTVHLDIGDLDGLAAASVDAAESGFAAKMCIHPDHAAVIRSSFAPAPADAAWARGVLAAARDEPSGVFRYEGRMIDAPVLAQAESIVRRACG
ncbi:citrate lyase subunit beta/citryl-CoA lyase [Murinocardiopsis flavida]|uniref:Citrate lyase subunit beta/citryl-CoA lyase n=1 Tax=Murinocardiopsis flavida TaxID=645275 RepID=A0A2P8CXE4_9ACTN|nr:CoA ester lyase [Murinocardiopsis flavida]PSK89655.1 citrate lyase subunit beta/citryl-CoA lyase [Murinocardiopsis flavida]